MSSIDHSRPPELFAVVLSLGVRSARSRLQPW